MKPSPSRTAASRARTAGFTLLEIMVALSLGLLLSIGILSLFSSTSRTNKLQNGLSRLQESGRFAVSRIESDLRMTGAQYCSNQEAAGQRGVTPILPVRAPQVLADRLLVPDPGPGVGDTSLPIMNSLDAAGYPTNAAATGAYALSPRYFVQGYACTGATCTPAGLPSGLPAPGTNAGQRVQGSDVLTIRYGRGSGWGVEGPTSCGSGSTLQVLARTGDDPVNFVPGPQIALVTDCVNSSVLPIAGYTGSTLTLGVPPGGATATCKSDGARDMRVFNFSKDFVTVTYYLALRADADPDARPNSPSAATRVIPVLIRRENGTDQELVQGVDQLAFRYGVQDPTGRITFMTADQINAAAGAACSPPPAGVVSEPGCLWRSVRTIEAHLLVNTVNEVMNLDAVSRQYRFLDTVYSTTDASLLPSSLRAGSMLRREFIAHVSNRNFNF